jgi:hypothetical protein
MEKSQRSASTIEKQVALTEQKTAQRARVLAILAFMSSTSDNQHMEFSSRGFNTAINIRRCAVLKKRPAELMLAIFVGQPSSLEVCQVKLKPTAVCGSTKPEKRQ